jgi:FixJ family two-component response regulator
MINVEDKRPAILLVDDEASILTELEIILCRHYDVHTFMDPEQVEAFLETTNIDLIVCDEMMPEMRGSELLSRIHKKFPDICKIVLSGQAEKNDVVKAINEGRIFSFLFKPVNRQQLLNVIEKGLENRVMKLLLEKQNEELRDLNENLENKVKERTAQLIKAHKRLEELDENKMSFLIYLSYEMNSPLDRIKKLANAIFAYFGLAGSDISPSPKSVFYAEAVGNILANEKKMIEEKQITVVNQVPKDAMAFVDPKYWRLIIEPLVRNALVFCNIGGTITLNGDCKVGEKTIFTIRDTGRGIAGEDCETIFKPFVITPDKRSPDGFGLNLPLVKLLVEAHGGKISAESPGVERGATFTLQL